MEQFDASYADTYSNEIVENPVLNEYRQDNYYYCTTGAKQITVSHWFPKIGSQITYKEEYFVEANEEKRGWYDDAYISYSFESRVEIFESKHIEGSNKNNSYNAGYKRMKPSQIKSQYSLIPFQRPNSWMEGHNDKDSRIKGSDD